LKRSLSATGRPNGLVKNSVSVGDVREPSVSGSTSDRWRRDASAVFGGGFAIGVLGGLIGLGGAGGPMSVVRYLSVPAVGAAVMLMSVACGGSLYLNARAGRPGAGRRAWKEGGE